jgi:hypothetical protein
MAKCVVSHLHRLTLAGGSSRRLLTPESPTDSPRCLRTCPGDRYQQRRLTTMDGICWVPGGAFAAKYLIDIGAIHIAPKSP